MFAQLNLVQSLSKAILLAGVATAAVLTSGCATPTGAAFTKAEAAPAGQAQVYLYRKSAFQAGGQNSSVQLNNQDMGELFNGSWMRFTLPPGEHVLAVKPSSISKTYETRLQLVNQQTQYVEFAVPPLMLGNMFMLGSDITPRKPEQGVADMQGLKGVR